MTPIVIKNFKGMAPQVAPKLLPDGFAQTAINCDMRQGNLKPVKQPLAVIDTEGTFANVRSLIRMNPDLAATNSTAWAFTAVKTDFVRAQIPDSNNRILATSSALSLPMQFDSSVYITENDAPNFGSFLAEVVGDADLQKTTRLGVVAPTTGLTATLTGTITPTEDDITSFAGCELTSNGSKVLDLPSANSLDSYTPEVGDHVALTSVTHPELDGSYQVEEWTDNDDAVDQLVLSEAMVTSDASAPTDIAIAITRSGDPTAYDSVVYVYTRVVKWPLCLGDTTSDTIQEEESAPSEPSEVYDIHPGQGVKLTGFLAGSDNLVTHFKIYRLASGTSGAEYFYLDEVEAATAVSDGFYDDLYAYGGDEHELLDVSDDMLETEGWIPPPDDLIGLTQFSNGILVGFVGNKLYMSEPWVPYAWPDAYTLTFDYDIVALAVHNESIIVLTEAFPYVVTGMDPESMTQTILPYEQSCVSSEGVAVTNVGVVYPSPDGLFLLAGNSGKLLTKGIVSKEQWAAMGAEDLVGFFYDDQYIAFLRGSVYGFTFNFKDNPYVSIISLSTQSPTWWPIEPIDDPPDDFGYVTGGFLDPQDDTLYLVIGGKLYAWAASDGDLTYEWHSKIYRPGDAANYSCGMVSADYGLKIVVFSDGTAREHIHFLPYSTITVYTQGDIVTYSGVAYGYVSTTDGSGKSPTSYPNTWVRLYPSRIDEMFRIIGGYRCREWYIALRGTATVDSFVLGRASGDLA